MYLEYLTPEPEFSLNKHLVEYSKKTVLDWCNAMGINNLTITNPILMNGRLVLPTVTWGIESAETVTLLTAVTYIRTGVAFAALDRDEQWKREHLSTQLSFMGCEIISSGSYWVVMKSSNSKNRVRLEVRDWSVLMSIFSNASLNEVFEEKKLTFFRIAPGILLKRGHEISTIREQFDELREELYSFISSEDRLEVKKVLLDNLRTCNEEEVEMLAKHFMRRSQTDE